jgi:hypothetical protein
MDEGIEECNMILYFVIKKQEKGWRLFTNQIFAEQKDALKSLR